MTAAIWAARKSREVVGGWLERWIWEDQGEEVVGPVDFWIGSNPKEEGGGGRLGRGDLTDGTASRVRCLYKYEIADDLDPPITIGRSGINGLVVQNKKTEISLGC